MTDQPTLVPIVTGAGGTIQAVYNQTSITGTTAVMPMLELWTNAAPVNTGNALPVFDAQALVNTGSILTSILAIQVQESLVAANTGSIATSLQGTLATAFATLPVALDVSTVPTSGTAVNALTAGHAAKGGVLYNPNTYTIYYAQIGNAGTVASGNTYPIAAGTSAGLFPSANAVSVNASTNGAAICGNGFT